MGDVLRFPDTASRLPGPTLPRLKLLRKLARLTRETLAEKIGVEAATIRDWESAAESIPDEYKAWLAEVFSVSVPFLMNWNEESA